MALIGLCLSCLILFLPLSGSLSHEIKQRENNINLKKSDQTKPHAAEVRARLSLPKIQLPNLINALPKNPFQLKSNILDGQLSLPIVTKGEISADINLNEIPNIPLVKDQLKSGAESAKSPNNPFYLFILNSRKDNKESNDLKNKNTLSAPINPDTKLTVSTTQGKQPVQSTTTLSDATNVNKKGFEFPCKDIITSSPQDILQSTIISSHDDCISVDETEIDNPIVTATENCSNVINLHNNISNILHESNEKCIPLETHDEHKSLKNETNKDIMKTCKINILRNKENVEVVKNGDTISEDINIPDESCSNNITLTNISKIMNEDFHTLSQIKQLDDNRVNEGNKANVCTCNNTDYSQNTDNHSKYNLFEEKNMETYITQADKVNVEPPSENPFKNKITGPWQYEKPKNINNYSNEAMKTDSNFIYKDKKNIQIKASNKDIPRIFRHSNKAGYRKIKFNYGNMTKPERMQLYCNQQLLLIKCNGSYKNHNTPVLYPYYFYYYTYI